VQALKLGESTLENVKRLHEEYGGFSQKENDSVCGGDDCFFYGISIYDRGLDKVLALRWRIMHARPIWRNLFSNRGPWRAFGVGLSVKRGRVIRIEVELYSTSSDGFIREGLVQVVPQIPDGPEPLRSGYRVYRFHMTTPGGGTGIGAAITPGASERDRQRAFQINLRCITTLRGCRELHEIMPAVWEDHQEYLRLHESPR
jgi:hypothetical protein